MSKSIVIFAAVVLALGGGLFAYLQDRQDSEPEVAAASSGVPDAPAVDAAAEPIVVEFELAGMDGEMRNSSEWRGKRVLLNFWATWCGPCRREIPILKEFQTAYSDAGIEVIGVAVDFPDAVLPYAEEAQFNYPIVIGEQDAMAVAESSGVPFIGLPFTMIMDADGTLLSTHMGEIHQSDLDAIGATLTALGNGDIDRPAAINALN